MLFITDNKIAAMKPEPTVAKNNPWLAVRHRDDEPLLKEVNALRDQNNTMKQVLEELGFHQPYLLCVVDRLHMVSP